MSRRGAGGVANPKLSAYQSFGGFFCALTRGALRRSRRASSTGVLRMAQPDDLERLRDLEARIARARAAHEPQPPRQDGHTLAQHGWRMVTELVAGLLLGLGIGWGLDWAFDTRPLFLVVFVLLGLVAGVRVMLRTAAELQRQHDRPGAAGARGDAERG